MTRARFLLLVLAVLLAGGAAAEPNPAVSRFSGERIHVVVELASPPLALARGVTARRGLDEEQRRFTEALHSSISSATVHWRYRLVANGMSVLLPRNDLGRLAQLPGVRHVLGPTTYGVLAGPDAVTIRARELPGSALASAGEGIRIGIIDDGVDQRHPFFDPAGYTMPDGFPKGRAEYTTAKVIVARAFPPPGTTWPHAAKPFDPEESSHGTHVAGIAAGNANTLAQGSRISGIAPRAYIGNYKALTVPTDAGVGLDGNAPELVAAIEAAVGDGMDVINLSIGEPEIEPSRDLVALALDAAAAAGVVPVVAAGNDFQDFGEGSLASPGSSAGAITVGATSSGASPSIASFSAAGPTPISLRLKPDVVAPGSGLVSAAPDGWRGSSGTSMAAPHVSGAVALLLQRHPDWTPIHVKAALTTTARPIVASSGPVRPTRAGAGLVDVTEADQPLVRAVPGAVSFGLVRAGQRRRSVVELVDAGGGEGDWAATLEAPAAPAGTAVTVLQPVVSVPGSIPLELTAGTVNGEVSGVLVLRRDGRTRRVAFWGRVATPTLAAAGARLLARPGVYAGDTRRRPARVGVYRYPEVPSDGAVTGRLAGPEQSFRVRITRPVANFGVVITSRGARSRVEPRVVVAGDENRLTGYAALPLHHNPYVDEFGEPTLAAGAIRPAPGIYHIVFDSPDREGAGSFRFRFWIDDVSPPGAKLTRRTVAAGEPLRVRVGDAGSGIDARSIEATLGGREVTARLQGDEIRIPTRSLAPGRYRLRVELADHQETRNNENVPRILPNTRVLTATVTIRRGG